MLTIQHSGPDGEITTTFEYDGIQRLVRVTDTEGNVTTSTYDMGDRRTEVNHPASGITSFTYDALGNVLTKQTANLAKEGDSNLCDAMDLRQPQPSVRDDLSRRGEDYLFLQPRRSA